MNTTGKLLSLVGASCLAAFATTAPAQAAPKPCCYTSSGTYENVTSSTCLRYGGRLVSQGYCGRGYYGRGNYGPAYQDGNASFSIQFGNVVIGYSDGYYDGNRRWHRWRNDRERSWYQQNRRTSYYHTTRDRDRDRKRRDWRNGRRNDWR